MQDGENCIMEDWMQHLDNTSARSNDGAVQVPHAIWKRPVTTVSRNDRQHQRAASTHRTSRSIAQSRHIRIASSGSARVHAAPSRLSTVGKDFRNEMMDREVTYADVC